jgi:hypothetical protein
MPAENMVISRENLDKTSHKPSNKTEDLGLSKRGLLELYLLGCNTK